MRGLKDFEGRWRLDRTVRLALEHVFEGEATLTPDGGHHLWHEVGTMNLFGGESVRAERRYLWREAGPLIEVLYEDGRPFHAFDPNAPVTEVEHLCAPDTYRGRYDLSGFPRWRLSWDVRGPRKGYHSTTVYSRLEQSAPLGDTPANET